MLSDKQGGIKLNILSLWYDTTRDWTPVFQTIGEHQKHYANEPVDSNTWYYITVNFLQLNVYYNVYFFKGLPWVNENRMNICKRIIMITKNLLLEAI